MGFFYSQLFVTPAYPTRSFEGETVIITGANTGLGLEAARHVARLGVSHLILACRNTTAGETAKDSIYASLNSTRKPAIDVWQLDLASFDSVKSFSERAQSLPRLDVLLCNAGVALGTWSTSEGHERTVTVNVLGTFLLSLLLVPKLEASAKQFKTTPRLSIVVSEVHAYSAFKQQKEGDLFAALDDQSKGGMEDRYPLSKLLQVLCIRYGLEPALERRKSKIIVNYINPGLCHSELNREGNFMVNVMKRLLGRTTEVGSRTLMAGISAGEESRGAYMNDGVVANEALSPFVQSEEGKEVGQRLWKQLLALLDNVSSGVSEGF